jgi:hypothetical protein
MRNPITLPRWITPIIQAAIAITEMQSAPSDEPTTSFPAGTTVVLTDQISVALSRAKESLDTRIRQYENLMALSASIALVAIFTVFPLWAARPMDIPTPYWMVIAVSLLSIVSYLGHRTASSLGKFRDIIDQAMCQPILPEATRTLALRAHKRDGELTGQVGDEQVFVRLNHHLVEGYLIPHGDQTGMAVLEKMKVDLMDNGDRVEVTQ